jgi:cobalamin biosynthesis Mg chelatase CobN
MSSSNLPDPLAIERQLRQQLAAVLAAPKHSAIGAKAMSCLLRSVMYLPGIKKVNHQDYALALNQTWEWMSRNIEEFRSTTDSIERDLVKWINGYLYWRIHDLYHPNIDRQQPLSLDEKLFENGETYLDLLSESGFIDLNLNNLTEHVRSLQQQEHQQIANKIETWIERDPDRQLQTCYLRDRESCNCQILGFRLIVKDPPDSLTAIAKELNVPYQTLVAHWKRRCLPLLQTKAKSLGYESRG